MNFNRVILGGHLTRDIELKHLPGGSAIASFGVAVNRRFKDASGGNKEEVTFVDCDAWGKTAEAMSQYLSKGRAVLIEGRLKLDQWDDKASGEKRSKMKVVVESFSFADSKGSESRDESPRRPAATAARFAPPPEDDPPF